MGRLQGIRILKEGRLQPVNRNSLLLTVDLDCVVLGGALEDQEGAIIRWLQGAFDCVAPNKHVLGR